MDTRERLAALLASWAEISDLHAAAALLGWDQETYMPKKAAEGRAVTMATLAGVSHDKLTSPHIGELLSNDLGEVLDGAKVAVVGNGKGADVGLLKRWAKDNVLLDLERVGDELRAVSSKYDGICW